MDSNLFENILQNLTEAVYFVDVNRKITFWNKAAERITGYKSEEVVNFHCFDNILNHVDSNGKKLCLDGCPLHATIKDGKLRDGAVFLQHKKGHRVAVNIKTVPLKDNDEIIGAVEIFNDNEHEYNLYKKIESLKVLSTIDQLTSIPNRNYMTSYLNSKFHEYKNLNIPFGILFIDIDKFKKINDVYGHEIGDEVLKMVANVLQNSMRQNDIIGRWGGEEFIGIFQGLNLENLAVVAEKTRMLIEESELRKDLLTIKVTISIGATVVNEADTIESIVNRADSLMYQSKLNGRNLVTIHY